MGSTRGRGRAGVTLGQGRRSFSGPRRRGRGRGRRGGAAGCPRRSWRRRCRRRRSPRPASYWATGRNVGGGRRRASGRRRRWPGRATGRWPRSRTGCGPASGVSTTSRRFSGANMRLAADADPVGRCRVGLVDLAVEAVDEDVLVLDDPRLVVLAVEARAGVGVDLDLEPDRPLALAGDGVVGGGVLADPVVPDLVGRPAGREGAEVAEQVLLLPADVRSRAWRGTAGRTGRCRRSRGGAGRGGCRWRSRRSGGCSGSRPARPRGPSARPGSCPSRGPGSARSGGSRRPRRRGSGPASAGCPGSGCWPPPSSGPRS